MNNPHQNAPEKAVLARMSLGPKIKTIQDIMRKDVGVDGDAQRLGQLAWMLFLKIFDDQEKELQLTERGYAPAIPTNLAWHSWAGNPEGITGDELLDFVNTALFPALKNLAIAGKANRRKRLVRGVFEDAYNYMKSGTLLRQVVNKINDVDFNSSRDRHDFGTIYEHLLRQLQSAGNAGEYYTPRPITRFATEMTAPRLGDLVLDPACGTGGFLTAILDYVRSKDVRTAADEERLLSCIVGVEKKPLPHMLCTTNMLLHGVRSPLFVRHDNALARPLRDYGPRDQVDIVLTNPPFGGIEEDGIESNFPTAFRTRETADLFLTLIMRLLTPRGRAAIVLPDGTLFGEGVKTRIKERLLADFNLHTIIRLPNGVFSPYTNIRTNILFFDCARATDHIWYFEVPPPNGKKSYSKTFPFRDDDLRECREWWNERRETEQAWCVDVDTIVKRDDNGNVIAVNLDAKNPNAAGADRGKSPSALVDDIGSKHLRIIDALAELRSLLVGAPLD